MANLKVKVAGVEFKNPVIMASGTFGFGKEYDRFYDVSCLGGIATKGLTYLPREGNFGTRIAETSSGILNSVGLQNPGVEAFINEDLPFLEGKDIVSIVNVAGNTKEDYIKLIERLNQTSVHLYELNISCPNVKEGGIAFGVEPVAIEDIVTAVKKKSKKPLIVKLSPNVANIGDCGKAAENGGADAISLINTITAMAVDYKTRKPILGNITGGLSGPAIKPVALRQVWDVYKRVKVPIIGMGGIMTAGDVLEFMIVGAKAVQIGTANIYNPLASKEILEDLKALCKELKISDINSIVGSCEKK